MIHTTGDSHCWIPYDKILGVKSHRLGPVLAFSVGRDGLNRVNISTFGMKPNDWIIFCFGEIDCRGHIHKHVTPENTYQKQIDYIVEKYFNTIKLNEDAVKFNINIAVNNVVPAYPFDATPYDISSKVIGPKHPFPFIGSDKERMTYVKYFNGQLKKYCNLYNYLFIDVHDEYADDDGFLNFSLSDQNVHIGNPKHLINFLKENSLL